MGFAQHTVARAAPSFAAPSFAARWFAALPLALLIALSALPPAGANDSAASLAAGGLVALDRTDRVAMASEVLRIGPERIDIAYTFASTTGQAETLPVAFPLPPVNLADTLYSPWTVESDDPVNFVGFVLTIDGVPATPEVQQRAYAPDGRDVTDLLHSLDLPLISFVDPPGQQPLWERLEGPDSDASLLATLGQHGLVNEWGAADWRTETMLHWRMTVPADRPLLVEHSYRPVYGVFQLYFFEDSDWRGELADWCVGDYEMSGIRRVAGEDGAIVRTIDYILTTGANWAGPIGDFHLILDKGSPDAILSLCWDGELTRTAPTIFEFRARDWTPAQELSLAIFKNIYDW